MRDGRYAAGGTMADKLNGIRLRLCAVVWELEAILPLAQARVSWQEEAVISRVRGES